MGAVCSDESTQARSRPSASHCLSLSAWSPSPPARHAWRAGATRIGAEQGSLPPGPGTGAAGPSPRHAPPPRPDPRAVRASPRTPPAGLAGPPGIAVASGAAEISCGPAEERRGPGPGASPYGSDCLPVRLNTGGDLNPWRYAAITVGCAGQVKQELTGSEIVSREIDPVLFIHLLTTDNFPLLLC